MDREDSALALIELMKKEEPLINQIQKAGLPLFENYTDFGMLLSTQGIAWGSRRLGFPDWSLVKRSDDESSKTVLDAAMIEGMTPDELVGGILTTAILLRVWSDSLHEIIDLFRVGLEQLRVLSQDHDCEEEVAIIIEGLEPDNEPL